MQICPMVCTTTYEIALTYYALAAGVGIVIGFIFWLMKKIKLWQFLLILTLLFVFAFLTGFKINACDSGCEKNGSIKFENELFGEKD